MNNNNRAALLLLAFAMFIVSLDQYIVVVALPEIDRELGYSPQTLQAVVSAYVIASSGFLLLGGRASDLLGRRRVLVFGLLLYCLASLAGGLAGTPQQQLIARAVQGLGGALVFPSTLALINVLFEQGEARNRALGVWAGAGAAGLVVGVLAGGVLTSAFGWQAVFLVNVPLAALAMAAAFRFIEPDGPGDRSRKFDVPGALTGTGAITFIVVALVEGPNLGWRSPLVISFLAAGVMLGLSFIAVEKHSTDPLLPFHMLRNRWLVLGLIVGSMFMATFGSLLYFLSLFFQQVLHYQPLAAGLAFLLPTAIVVAASTLSGPIVSRVGIRRIMLSSLAIGAIGAIALGLGLRENASFLSLVPGLIAVSIGDGALFTAIFIAAATDVPDHEQGVASAIVSTGQGIGAVLGLGVLVLIANAHTHGLAGDQLRLETAAGIAHAAYAISGGIILTLLIVLLMRLPALGRCPAPKVGETGQCS